MYHPPPPPHEWVGLAPHLANYQTPSRLPNWDFTTHPPPADLVHLWSQTKQDVTFQVSLSPSKNHRDSTNTKAKHSTHGATDAEGGKDDQTRQDEEEDRVREGKM